MLALAIVSGGLALIVARRLNRGYIQTLERSLVNRAVELDLSDIEDITTRTAMLKTRQPDDERRPWRCTSTTADTAMPVERRGGAAASSRCARATADQVVRVLRDEDGLAAALVPHVIPLLAWDAVAEEAVRALRKVAEERLGTLTDALLDPNQPFAVRRRLARVFSICVSQRAVDALLLALDDPRFEVRFQCGRSLSAILAKNQLVRIDRERIFEVVRTRGRP